MGNFNWKKSIKDPIQDRAIITVATAQKKFFIKDFFCKCDQIPSFQRIWSHLLKKSLMQNFIFCAVCNCSKCKVSEGINRCY